MSNGENEKPPEEKEEPVRPSNEDISGRIIEALKGDESLTDDDRKAIGEGIATGTGGTAPAPVKPDSDHWTTRKLW